MDVSGLVQLSNFLAGLPLHAILIFAVAVLWQRMNKLQDDLEECMKTKS